MRVACHLIALTALTGCAEPVVTSDEEYQTLLTRPDARSTPINWNGEAYIFVDYPTEDEYLSHTLVPVKLGDRSERAIMEPVVVEGDGGLPRIQALGPANLDADAADELVVIWVNFGYHYDVSANFYEVQVFDDQMRDQTEGLVPLPDILGSDASGCECDYRDESEPDRHFELTSIEAVEERVRNRD